MSERRAAFLLGYYGQLASSVVKKQLAQEGFKPGHAHVLTHLTDGGPLGQQDLLEELGVDPSVLVALLNDLEGEGLVERKRNPADRRRHIVEPTSAGRAAAARIDAIVAQVDAVMFADFTDEELAVLRGLLARIPTDGVACDED